MKDILIKNYINSLSIKDVKNFAIKNNITLNDNELNFIYRNIKDNWKVLIYGNPENLFNNLKNNVSNDTYLKIIDLYTFYKNKYQYFL